jgi:hypothetical protein
MGSIVVSVVFVVLMSRKKVMGTCLYNLRNGKHQYVDSKMHTMTEASVATSWLS